VDYSTRFLALGSIFFQHPGCARTPCRRHLARFPLIFGPYGTRFGPFRPVYISLQARITCQTESEMMHFDTLTVPPPRTNHSLMHNNNRGISPGQKGLQVRFCENVRSEPFSWVAHDFQHSGQFVSTSTEARMMHFVTLTGPPPHTNHSLMHNTTRSTSPGQKAL
jgi:hypothetical protein